VGVEPHIVIVGGGFGGVAVARRLEQVLKPRAAKVTLVSPENALLFTPLLSLTAAGVVEPRHAVAPLRGHLPHTTIALGCATTVDLQAETVVVEHRSGTTESLRWDRLVLAPGSVTRLPDVPGLADRALGAKTLSEAVAVHNHVMEQLEFAEVAPDEEERRRRTTFVVAGGGHAGTEFAAELHSATNRALQHYPRVRACGVRWILLQHGARILPELGERLGGAALRIMRRRGIDVRLETTVEEVGPSWIRLTDGEVVPTETLIWTAGVAARPWTADMPLPHDERGRIVVDADLAVAGYKHVFALGDAARVPDPRGPLGAAPPTATHASRQGAVCADRIAASLGHGRPRAHRHHDHCVVVNLGHRTGVGRVLGVQVTGAVGWAAALAHRVASLPSGHRIRVAFDWATSSERASDIAELGGLGNTDPRAAAEPHIPRQRSPALDTGNAADVAAAGPGSLVA
jgi:NADH dehydrogenase